MPINPLNQGHGPPVNTVKATSVNQTTPANRQQLPDGGDKQPSKSGASAVNSQDVKQAAEKLNEYVQVIRRDLKFSVDEDTGRTIVKVIDSRSGELIRQIPDEEVIAISKLVGEHLEQAEGILFKGQV
ncbi:MAG: flagellar protein FlaG [Gammaproteobacteria bacterium]|nr:MAG: flagellar protein FlaG [Gammaproteobacteria bacterium]